MDSFEAEWEAEDGDEISVDESREFMSHVTCGDSVVEAAAKLGYTEDQLRSQRLDNPYLDAAFMAADKRNRSRENRKRARQIAKELDFRSPEGFQNGVMALVSEAGGPEKLFDWIQELDTGEFKHVELLWKIMARLTPQLQNTKSLTATATLSEVRELTGTREEKVEQLEGQLQEVTRLLEAERKANDSWREFGERRAREEAELEERQGD